MESKTKKKIGGGVAGVAAVGAAVALTAGTFSYFSSQQNSPSQKVEAGTLTLKAGGNGTSSAKSSFSNVRPGYTSSKRTITFHNAGSMAGRLRLQVVGYGSDTFKDDVHLTFTGAGQLNGDHSIADDVSESEDGTPIVHKFGKGSYKSIGFRVHVPSDVNNELQGKVGGFKIRADLVQTDKDGNLVGSGDHPFQADNG
jgi:predicted ribosomally synthesized peptide with SipW-like signal peptide